MGKELFTDRLSTPEPTINENWGGQCAVARAHQDKGDLRLEGDALFSKIVSSPSVLGAQVLVHAGLSKVERAVEAVRERTGL